VEARHASCYPPRCRKIGGSFLRPASGLSKRGLPSGTVGDRVQHPPGVIQVLRVAWGDGFPGIAGRVSCRNTERPQQPVLPVGAVIGQRLAGPLARDQHPAPGITEVIGIVGLALAPAGDQARPGVLGLDAVPEPVRAGRRARLIPHASASRAACARCGSVWAWWQSPTCLVRYLVRYPMQRAASFDPASTPWASNRTPNRATCHGSSSSPMASSAWSQVGSTSPVAGSR
jgi:hypothetical protein